ncbi:carboxy terminal-processing peptidase [Pseudomonadota bacterium]|nr:carboxy terminal-processing peptidase [Pseudomonadota bacterium]
MKKITKNLFLLAFFGISLFVSSEKVDFSISEKYQDLSSEIFKNISSHHYTREIDKESFNDLYIDALLEELDGNKNLFLSYEIKSFKRKSSNYKKNRENFDINLAYEILNTYFNRVIEISEYQIKLAKKDSFNLSIDEGIDIFYDDNEYASTMLELKERWRKTTKNDFIVSVLAKDDKDEIISNLTNRYERRIKRVLQRKDEDIFLLAINIMTRQFDPHSTYLSPYNAEDFEIDMSLKLGGIGALLSNSATEDYAIIVSLVPGGPAEKNGELEPNDKIVKIKQQNEDIFEDVTGWRIDEVVQKVRGEPQTLVTLEIIPGDAEDNSVRKIIEIEREIVELEERAAKSKIYSLNKNGSEYKIGIIDLPSFYLDFEAWQARDPNYKSSSKDVKNILDEFKKQSVDAVLVDLRNNSGGALTEANKLTGLFTSAGATLQIKESNGNIIPWGDARVRQAWSKPMAVLVNRYSASASEIFAGAIQDYQRGLVIGQRTFGKGTVQRLDNLSEGQLKITESKFYRVSGDSTQSRGIDPDIVLPSTWDIETVGESSLPTHLPWDKIKPTRYRTFTKDSIAIEKTIVAFEERLSTDPNLIYLKDVRSRYDQNKNKMELSLNIDKRRYEQEERKQWLLEVENKRRSSLGMEIFKDYESMDEFNDNFDPEDIDTIRDYSLLQGIEIIGDYIDSESNFLSWRNT